MPDFDVQAFLADMRAEYREDHRSLATRVDEGFKELSATAMAVRDGLVQHTADDLVVAGSLDKRLAPIEKAIGSFKWMGRIFIGAVVVGVVDLMFHLAQMK